jgi:hypothetical protein
MKWITLPVIFFITTIAFAVSETVVTKTITDGVDDHPPLDFCRNSPNSYTRESCQQIRQSERVRDNAQDPKNVTTVIQNKVVEPSTNNKAMPAWQQALQPPASSTTTSK